MSILSSVAPVVSMAHARHAHSGSSGTSFAKLLSATTTPAASTSVAATGTAAPADAVSVALGGLQRVLDLLQGH
ncbi:MAG: hypothetical protein ACRYGI_08710 [Janthinobacterium lividum]